MTRPPRVPPELPGRYADNPVLASVLPVLGAARSVHINPDRIAAVAGWMAYEELPFPAFLAGLPPVGGRAESIDFAMVGTSIDFAFTDFGTALPFRVTYRGATFSDSDALFACLHRALSDGIPLLDGHFLAQISDAELAALLHGDTPIPMLSERAAILREVGSVLCEHYGGRFHNLVDGCPPRLRTRDGTGIVDTLTARFPRFDDVSAYHGHRVRFDKLAQLAVWVAHNFLGGSGGPQAGTLPLPDLDQMTAFADYILPLALELLGILEYGDDLAAAIASHTPIERDSDEEIEIRAHTVYAVALLTEAINAIRPSDRAVVMAQVDARLWTHFHATFRPHHLTRTVMY